MSTELLERARDELFSHITRCGVLEADEDEQRSWMDDTIGYLAERFPELKESQLEELRVVGLRFCRPAIPHGNRSAVDDGAE